jgi:hypothetical protein
MRSKLLYNKERGTRVGREGKIVVFNNTVSSKIRVLFCVVTLILFQACAFVEGPDELNSDFGWEKKESNSYVFYYREDSSAEKDIDKIVTEQENVIAMLKSFLEVGYREKIHVYIFSDMEDSGFDGKSGHAITIMNTIEVIYGKDGHTIGKPGISAHEVSHILTYNGWGNTGVKFLSEGICVAMEHLQEYEKENDLYCYEDAVFENGFEKSIPSIESLVNNFESYPSRKSYCLSGAFVGFILHHYGVNKFCQFFTVAEKDNFSDDFNNIYHISLEKVENDWREYLESASKKLHS